MKGTPIEIMGAFVSAMIGVTILGAALMGYFVTQLRAWEWLALMAGSFLFISVGWIQDLIGLGLAGTVFLVQW